MNATETAALLARMQLIDNRRVDEAVILEWQQYLVDLDVRVAMEALTLHRSESSAWVTPAHILQTSERILRAEAHPVDEFGNELAPDVRAVEARSRLAVQGVRQIGAGS